MIERRAGGSRCVFFLGMIDGEMDIWEGMATKSGMVSIDVHECSFKGAEDSRREREELERGLRLRFGLVHRRMIFFRSLEFLFGRRDGVSTYCVEKERKRRESARKR